MNSSSDVQSTSVENESIPDSYWVGQELDWEATTVPVVLQVELPYWLMVPDCTQNVEVNGHTFSVDIKDGYVELYVKLLGDSKSTCLYAGPPQRPRFDVQKALARNKAATMYRKCKTVLLIHSDCNGDVVAAAREKSRRKTPANLYLRSFCEAHLEILNHLIQQYRLSTYDYFAYELSPWDVPIWFLRVDASAIRVVLQDYATWDQKPMLFDRRSSEKGERYKLIDPLALQTALAIEPTAGEFDLLDALNLMERGDYSGAVRRITTAIELQMEFALMQELLKTHTVTEARKRLKRTESKFPCRVCLYQTLSGGRLSDWMPEELKRTRKLRHSIVHDGMRITFSERGLAQKSVDTGRWIFDRLENQPARFDIREKKIGKRSLGRHVSIYHAEITPTGVVVHRPHFAKDSS